MTIINIHEAKTHLSKLLQRVICGEEIVIAKSGKPVAKIIPFMQKLQTRVPGSAKGKIWVSTDFNKPLPEEILDVFEGQRSQGNGKCKH